ncbi:MAG: adaptor protein MecA [Lachnospira eligens]
MEFKKIGDRKFQCRLNAEDLEDNNISLDDFFNNDAEKIRPVRDYYGRSSENIELHLMAMLCHCSWLHS